MIPPFTVHLQNCHVALALMYKGQHAIIPFCTSENASVLPQQAFIFNCMPLYYSRFLKNPQWDIFIWRKILPVVYSTAKTLFTSPWILYILSVALMYKGRHAPRTLTPAYIVRRKLPCSVYGERYGNTTDW